MDALKTSAGLEEQIRPAGVEAQPAVRSGLLGRWVLLLGSIALVCVMACHNIGKGEFDYYIDEAQHAVTGLFVADFLHDLPLRHPVQYAYLYYAQYPAVAILHWPPLFYLFEGLSFLLLGPSVVSARLTVIFFSVVLLYQWFLLVEELQDSYTAAISTAVLGLLPMVLLFEKTVMLEIPSLALCVGAIRHWIRYLDQGRRSSLYYFGLWLSAALMCKQTSVSPLPMVSASGGAAGLVYGGHQHSGSGTSSHGASIREDRHVGDPFVGAMRRRNSALDTVSRPGTQEFSLLFRPLA